MKRIYTFLLVAMATTLCATAQSTGITHEYVDLGLPSGTKWATCNVGATSPEEYGDYYAWGETTTKSDYSWETYKYANGNYDALTKYCSNSSYGNDGFTDALTTLEAEDDAATANWGSAWRMPTNAEWEELRKNCDWVWTYDYDGTGVAGHVVVSKTNGNSIFLPAAGYRSFDYIGNAGLYGNYWSSSLDADSPSGAWRASFYSDDVLGGYDSRWYGQSVRPVQDISSPVTALQPAESIALYTESGRIICAQEFQIFTLTGQNVTEMNGSLCGVYIVKVGDKAQKVVVSSK